MKKSDLSQKLDEFITELRYQEKADRTLIKYRADVIKFIDSVNHENDVTKDDVLSFKKILTNSDYEPTSINSYIVAVNKFLRWCGNEEMRVKKLKIQQVNSLDEVISEKDYKRLLRFAKTLGHNDIYMIMKIIATTGIRIGELKYFTVDSIETYYINVRNKGKDRVIILTQELARELRKYCRDNRIKEGRIFNLPDQKIWRRMKKVAGAAKVNKSVVHAHSFRHLFAIAFMEKYNNLPDLADILGHSKLETTRIYTRSTNQMKRKNLENLRKKGTR
ncbi:MAG: tyrosine-type recombinase/integrase [Candidatus Dehalobacter alkaniphilus]